MKMKKNQKQTSKIQIGVYLQLSRLEMYDVLKHELFSSLYACLYIEMGNLQFSGITHVA